MYLKHWALPTTKKTTIRKASLYVNFLIKVMSETLRRLETELQQEKHTTKHGFNLKEKHSLQQLKDLNTK